MFQYGHLKLIENRESLLWMTLLLATILYSYIDISTLLIFGQRNAIKQSVVGRFCWQWIRYWEFQYSQRSHGHTLTVEFFRFLRINKVLSAAIFVLSVTPLKSFTQFVCFHSHKLRSQPYTRTKLIQVLFVTTFLWGSFSSWWCLFVYQPKHVAVKPDKIYELRFTATTLTRIS